MLEAVKQQNITIARSGFVAVAGRPNVGKSTLLNRLIGDKVSIVSHRRQTTRTIVRALSEDDGAQIVWLDSPGWQTRHSDVINRALNAAAEWAAYAADIIVFVSAAKAWTRTDAQWLARIPDDKPVIAVINKSDIVADKNEFLPAIADMAARRDFAAIIPLSAKTGGGIAALRREVGSLLPAGGAMFASTAYEENAADRDFFFAELMREKLFRHLGDELPYSVGVVVDSVVAEDVLLKVEMYIYTDKESQKRMIIGKGGGMLKKLGRAARLDMERCAGKKIFLSVRVKTANWRIDKKLLQKMRIGVTEGG